MPTNASTTKMLRKYEQGRRPALFFTGLFNSPRENFHSTESVELDIQRNGERVAVAVSDISAGPRFSNTEIYTNKKFTPPMFHEGFQLNSFDMASKMAGRTQYEESNYMANMMSRFAREMPEKEAAILRAVELQASQVMQTGTATLKDANGNSVYTIDYSPKATHFPTASTAWDDSATVDILGDLEDTMDVIRDDGQADPVKSVWSTKNFDVALQNTAFLARYNKDSATMANAVRLAQGQDSRGVKFRGVVDVGNYPLEIWTLSNKYKDVETGLMTPYLSDTSVVIWCPEIRLDLTWGNVSTGLVPDPRMAQLRSRIPRRIRRSGMAGVDMITNVWTDAPGNNIFGSIAARPLAIPTAIDQFGCINTGV